MKRASIAMVLLLAASPAYADAIQYTCEWNFLQIIKNPFLFENFDSYTYRLYTQPTLTLEGNGYSAVLSAEHNLYSLDSGMSTKRDTDILVIDFSGSPTPVTAVGGFFFPSDLDGNDLIGYTKVTLFDGTQYVVEMGNASHNNFLGFGTAGSPFQYLEIEVLGDASDPHSWATVDHLYIGSDSPRELLLTPEPSSFVLIISGLVGICITARRRMKRFRSTLKFHAG
jgi:hypothetical protein